MNRCSSINTILLSPFRGRGWVRGVISKPYPLTLAHSLKGVGING
jgi:hypothetical protein